MKLGMSSQEAMVKRLLVLILTLGIVPIAAGKVVVEVREGDGETTFDGRDIIVGTKLTIIVSSDCNDYWSGGLFVVGQDRALGTLAGRGLDPNDPNARDYTESHYADTGELARVTAWKDSEIWGFDLYNFYPIDSNSYNDNNTVAGDWFIIDYEADEVGDCNVGFYDYNISWDDPNYCISFSHISPNLNHDQMVNFGDFAIFASQWNATDCNEPDWCDGADINHSGNVGSDDLEFFAEYWLWSFGL